ncbi:HEPN domain-containing protein [Brachybacterium muris]|uniref:HEPN domain-containing protein n=1 Tax=Brachybacterium muris TaxID=219301 RepID=UPI003B8A6A99
MSRSSAPPIWPHADIQLSRQRLVELCDLVRALEPDLNNETESALARFLVVRSCGHIEYVLSKSVSEAVRCQSSPRVHGYVDSGLFRGANPKPGRLVETLAKYDSVLAEELKEFLEEDDGLLSREIEFLVDRRNKIAHGQSEGIGRVKAMKLCEHSLDVADKIADLLNPF